MVGEVEKGNADFAFSAISENSERLQVVDFTASFYVDCYRFVVPHAKVMPKYKIIYIAFNWEVWLGLLIGIPGIIATLYILSINNNYIQIENKYFQKVSNISLMVSSQMLQVSVSQEPRRLSTRLLIGITWIVTFVLSVAYKSMFISLLSIPVYNKPIDSLKDLSESDITPAMYNYGGGLINIFNQSTDPVYVEIWRRMRFIPSTPEAIEKVKQTQNFAVLDTDTWIQLILLMNYTNLLVDYEDVHAMRECFSNYDIAWPVTKDASFKPSFDQVIMRLVETGHVQKWKKDSTTPIEIVALRKSLQSNINSSLKDNVVLSMNALLGVFFALFLGMLGSFTLFVMEIFNERKKEKKGRNKKRKKSYI